MECIKKSEIKKNNENKTSFMNNLTCIIKNQYRTEILDKIIVYVMEMISKKH